MDRTNGSADNRLAIAAIASAAGGVLHATAAGIHADHPELSRSRRPGRRPDGRRRMGLRPSRTRGHGGCSRQSRAPDRARRLGRNPRHRHLLDRSSSAAESPQPADTIAAVFAAVALVTATMALARRLPAIPRHAVTVVAVAAGVLVIPGLANATTSTAATSTPRMRPRSSSTTTEPTRAPAWVMRQQPPRKRRRPRSTSTITPRPIRRRPRHRRDGNPGTTPTTTHQHAVVTASTTPIVPIDLGGVPGVTPRSRPSPRTWSPRRFADLPQWSDFAVVDAAGFHSIGDGITGHEHYIQWDWIDDDVRLDPDRPESLVFEPQTDGSKQLVSASSCSRAAIRSTTSPTGAVH